MDEHKVEGGLLDAERGEADCRVGDGDHLCDDHPYHHQIAALWHYSKLLSESDCGEIISLDQ